MIFKYAYLQDIAIWRKVYLIYSMSKIFLLIFEYSLNSRYIVIYFRGIVGGLTKVYVDN